MSLRYIINAGSFILQRRLIRFLFAYIYYYNEERVSEKENECVLFISEV